jgi:hypothetical protein
VSAERHRHRVSATGDDRRGRSLTGRAVGRVVAASSDGRAVGAIEVILTWT